jgi:hypothetical protein
MSDIGARHVANNDRDAMDWRVIEALGIGSTVIMDHGGGTVVGGCGGVRNHPPRRTGRHRFSDCNEE